MGLSEELAVNIENLGFHYPGNDGVTFSGLNLKVKKGDRFGLFGPNGAGKTTLLSLMTGLLSADGGSIRLLGRDVRKKNKDVNKLIGFVPQDFSYYQELSPVENLEFFGAWSGLTRQQIKTRTDELLHILGLENVRDKQVDKFSGGMKRRVNLAIGVIHNPAILILDEPTVGVDVQTRHAIINYLMELNKNGTTLIYTSHQLSEAEGLCEEVALIDNGKIITQGTLCDLLKEHKHANLEELFLGLTGRSIAMIFKLWATIVKDCRVLVRDGIGLALMFIMPIVLVVVVTDIQNSTFQMINKNKMPVLVCNRDTGESGRQLITTINKIGLFKVYDLPKNQDTKTIVDSMKDKDALLSVVIPADFTSKVKAKAKSVSGKALVSFGLQADSVQKYVGDVSPLTLYYNPVLQEQLRFSVKGGLQSALQIVESRETLRTLYFAINEKQMPEKLENEMLNNKAAINEIPVSKNGSLRAPNAAQHNVPAWTIFAMFFVIMSLGGSVVREKISGSFIRLKTLPTNYAVGLLSKQITYVAVTVVQAAVIFSLGIWGFPLMGLPGLNVPLDVFGLLIVTIICGWCAVSYAICVGVFAETHQQSNGFGAISIVILAAIGGLMVPSFAMDTSLKSIANFSPMHWCLQAYYGLFLEGGKLTDVMRYLIPLIIITLVLQLITFLGLKRKNLI